MFLIIILIISCSSLRLNLFLRTLLAEKSIGEIWSRRFFHTFFFSSQKKLRLLFWANWEEKNWLLVVKWEEKPEGFGELFFLTRGKCPELWVDEAVKLVLVKVETRFSHSYTYFCVFTENFWRRLSLFWEFLFLGRWRWSISTEMAG